MISIPDITMLEKIINTKITNTRPLTNNDIDHKIIDSDYISNNNNNNKIKKYRQQGEYGAKKFIKP